MMVSTGVRVGESEGYAREALRGSCSKVQYNLRCRARPRRRLSDGAAGGRSSMRRDAMVATAPQSSPVTS
ncbi:hypothetical protein FTX61_14405 [Nitriliruptoraceae bacterium ZYF776]|nr:hypothetical protein [Profundirhabdus halotolerans]